jgi:excisionase family DNA binding protein
MPSDVDLIPSNVAADILGISRWTVLRRIESGEIPGVQLGNRWFLRGVTVAALRDQRLAEAEAEVARLRGEPVSS